MLEGVDGVGKTTIGKALSRFLGAHYYKTPPGIFERFATYDDNGEQISLRQYVDNSTYQIPHYRFLFYIFALIKASQEIEELLQTAHVVCDRYLSSTLAYHWVLNKELERIDLSWLPILRPDHEYLLVIDDEFEHKRRISARSHDTRTDSAIEANFQYIRLVQNKYRDFGLVEIDTSKNSIEAIVERLAEDILYGR